MLEWTLRKKNETDKYMKRMKIFIQCFLIENSRTFNLLKRITKQVKHMTLSGTEKNQM